MSKTLGQPIGQKRLTNVSIVRFKKHKKRFEIACYQNTVGSWRDGSEKDIDEVLQSHTVYTNVSKGILAKSEDLIKAFGTDDQTEICLEILKKGEHQVAGKEREALLSSQFRDIATIVMEKTINPETKRPYSISMIERLMHEVHFSVDPNSNSKKQALDVIRLLQSKYPIKRSPMRLRITMSEENFSSFSGKLTEWKAQVMTKDQSDGSHTIICELDPGLFRECDGLVRSLKGRLEMLALSVHEEGDTGVDQFDELSEAVPSTAKEPTEAAVRQLSERLQKQSVSTSSKGAEDQEKQSKCSTCDALVGDAKQYREHFKSEWHRHNLKRKTRNLPPLSYEECLADVEIVNSKENLKEYSF